MSIYTCICIKCVVVLSTTKGHDAVIVSISETQWSLSCYINSYSMDNILPTKGIELNIFYVIISYLIISYLILSYLTVDELFSIEIRMLVDHSTPV